MKTENIVAVKIEKEMKTSFLDYSMSVIVSRALPDVRDGLKPVHRRILFAMYGLKNFHNKPYLKSARIVGDVIGKYHPHGDTAVYDALVRMAQDFSLRYPVIDGQGNFGSIDGDSAAAMRYTESRLREFSEYLLLDLEKETVDFVPNYDNKDEEPVVMPSRVPQLLVNGASGIAVGMATNIPPHNLNEVVAGLKALIDNPKITIEELMLYIKGPDFPTEGEIHGLKGIRDAYLTGRGSINMRAKAHVEQVGKGSDRERIIVSQIPYQVNKAKLIEKIADLVNEKKIEGISDIRDESAKKEIRIVIDVRKGEQAEIILNHLYKLTPMQSNFGVNLVALSKGKPRLFNLKDMLEEFYHHRREVVLRRTAFLLKKNEEKAHLLVGLKIAVENSDPVIEIIRKAQDTQLAQKALIARFDLSELQAKAILDMRLARLTGLEREKIVKEYGEIVAVISDLKQILSNTKRVTQIILEELDEILTKFGDERKTQVITSDADEITMESLIADEEVSVTITTAGYVKRTPLKDIATQNRGGKGKSGMLMKEEDLLQSVFRASNHQDLLCFTNFGRVYNLKVYQLPEAELRARGKHFANLIRFVDQDEKVVSVLPIKEFKAGFFIYSVSKRGFIKSTDLMAYNSVRSSGIIGLKLDPDDQLIACALGTEKEDVLIATKMGKAIRFQASDVRTMGRASRGVTGIRFADDDAVIGMEILVQDSKSTVLSLCENGYGKRTDLGEYRVQSRGGKGIFTIKVTERNGPVVSICQVTDQDDLMIMTSSGKLMRIEVSQISNIGRHTQGVRLMQIQPGEKVVALSKIPKENKEIEAGSDE